MPERQKNVYRRGLHSHMF